MKHIKALGFGALCCLAPFGVGCVLGRCYPTTVLWVVGTLAVIGLCYSVGRIRYP